VTLGLQERTRQQYQDALRPFLGWLEENNLAPDAGCEFDDLLVEWRGGAGTLRSIVPTRSMFSKCISAMERILPHLKGDLVLAKGELSSWSVAFRPKHTTPLTELWGSVLASKFLDMGLPRMAWLLWMQCRRGLRPGEVLVLRGQDLVPCASYVAGTALVSVLLLGVKAGTKAKRPQSVRVEDPTDCYLVALMKRITRDSDLVTHVRTLSGYNVLLHRVQDMANLSGLWSAHGPRAGFVTQKYLEGSSPAEIAAVTRHVSLKSLQSYLDVQSVAVGSLHNRLVARIPEAQKIKVTLVPRLIAALNAEYLMLAHQGRIPS